MLSARPSPPGLTDAMMVYDAADGYVVLFGGYNATFTSNQTWAYNAGTWTQLHPKISPSARGDATMAYDPKDKEVVLYGGIGLGPNCQNGYIYCDDTWTFSAGQWTNITATAAGPGGLAYGSMTYDAAIGKLVLFGGVFDPCGCVDYVYTTLYAFEKGTWTLLHAKGSGGRNGLPGAEVSVAYDAVDHYLVEFGGWSHTSGSFVNYTWNFSAHRWNRLYPTPSPMWRVSDNLVFDPKLGGVILFGGLNWQGSAGPNDTWEFVGGSWTQLHPVQSPPQETYAASSAYDAADRCLLLFGGQGTSGGPSNDTWVFR